MALVVKIKVRISIAVERGRRRSRGRGQHKALLVTGWCDVCNRELANGGGCV
jgi:hypothetical protein